MNWNKINILIFIFFWFVSIWSVYINIPQKWFYDDIVTSDIEETLMWIKYNDEAVNTNQLYQWQITNIILHHTASPYTQDVKKLYNSINNNHKLRWIRWWIQKTWQQMMYHRLIGYDWSIQWDKDFNEIWWWTRENNVWTIHIALQGNFNEIAPSENQYNTLAQTIMSLQARYWSWLIIQWHWQLEEEHTACPWKLFDYEKLKKLYTPVVIEEIPPVVKNIISQWNEAYSKVRDWYTLFSLSRYYSVMPNQKRYYMNKTYEQDKAMNCWPWDCLIPASWIKLSNSNKNNSVACPKQYKLGTKIALSIKWEDHIVTCEDRWSAIVSNRLDMYCGVWDYALDNWNTCITWKIYWKVLSQ